MLIFFFESSFSYFFFSPRNLIFPVRFDAYIPSFYNHMIHSAVIPLQLLELALQYHIYPTKKTGMAITGEVSAKEAAS